MRCTRVSSRTFSSPSRSCKAVEGLLDLGMLAAKAFNFAGERLNGFPGFCHQLAAAASILQSQVLLLSDGRFLRSGGLRQLGLDAPTFADNRLHAFLQSLGLLLQFDCARRSFAAPAAGWRVAFPAPGRAARARSSVARPDAGFLQRDRSEPAAQFLDLTVGAKFDRPRRVAFSR